jgi:hypothetical protein
MSTLPPSIPPAPVTYAYTPQTVVISDINMSIGAMCRFMIKWVIAAIPAVFILWLLFVTFAMVLALVFGGFIHGIVGPWPNRF